MLVKDKLLKRERREIADADIALQTKDIPAGTECYVHRIDHGENAFFGIEFFNRKTGRVETRGFSFDCAAAFLNLSDKKRST